MTWEDVATAREDAVWLLEIEQLLHEVVTFLISWGVSSAFRPEHESVKNAHVMNASTIICDEFKGVIQASEYW